MKEVVKIKINRQQFPDQFAPDSVKKTYEYGLQVGQTIQWEWLSQSGRSCRFYDRMAEIHRLRMYARGKQSIQKYKDELAVNGDLSYLNLDWTPVPILPKFVDIVVNGMSERMFEPVAYAQDAMSQAKRSKYQDMIESQMVSKDVLLNIKELTGVDPFVTDPEKLPSSDEELSLYMQLNYKPAIEIAEEEAIKTLLEQNKWYEKQEQIAYDITTIGIGVARHDFLPGAGVELCYVDPVNWIHSYTEDPHFGDCFYFGEVKLVPMTELYKIDPSLTAEQLELISQYNQSWIGQYNPNQYYDTGVFSKDVCTLFYFNYKTTKKIVYKKAILENGRTKITEKEDTWDPPVEMMETGKFTKIEKTIDVWYTGIMVAGTEIMLQWKLSENMVRPKSASQHALPNYVACAPRMYKDMKESLLERMVPFADLIQLTHLKIQQVLNRVVPDGIYLDADGVNEVDLGNGAKYSVADALRLYFQTGSVIGRSYTQDGDYNQGKIPIQQLVTSSGSNKLQMLIANYNHYLDMIRGVTGLNEARDGSTPDPNALVGVQKLAALNSNTATRHILDASLSIFQGVCEALTYRISDILQFADFADDFANMIGKYNVSILNEIKDLYASDFGIFIEVAPDEEQKAQLEANIQIALAQKNIDIEDAIDIREIKNLKLANQLLKLKRAKKLEREEKMEMQKQAMLAQQNMASQELAAQTAAQKIKLETDSKMELIIAEGEKEIAVLTAQATLKSKLMKEEFEYNRSLTELESGTLLERDKMKESAKDKRIDTQSTQQSELINQRQLKLPPKRFESVQNDTLQDINFSDVNVGNR